MSLTHEQLVAMAVKWLNRKCSVIITELATTGETPDAIGWHGKISVLVECKTSRADFLADQAKYFRSNPFLGVGQNRYYLAPRGLIKVGELPEKWGLIEVQDNKIRVAKKSGDFTDVNARHEISILLSALRRIGTTAPIGISIKCYTMQSKCTATLTVNEGEELEIT